MFLLLQKSGLQKVTLYFTDYIAGYILPMQSLEQRSLGDRSLKKSLVIIIVRHSHHGNGNWGMATMWLVQLW